MSEQKKTFFWDIQQNIEHENFWKETLAGNLPQTCLPSGAKRGAGGELKSHEFAVSNLLYDQLVKISKNSDISLYLLFMSALTSLLYRYTGEKDSIIGSPVFQPAISGETANNLVLIRTRIDDDLSFKEMLFHIRDKTLKAYEHQNYPFSVLVTRLGLAKESYDLPRTICLLKNIHDETSLADVKNDMTLSINKETSSIHCEIAYNSSLWDEQTIQCFSDHFLNLLTDAVNHTDAHIRRLEFLSDSEKKVLVTEFNKTSASYPEQDTVVSLFEARVRETPEATAVIFEDRRLSYDELNRRANELAHYLQTLGTEPDAPVGICMERSIELVVSIMGVLKAGGAYLPLDADYPWNRLAFMIKDSNAKIIVTLKAFEEKFFKNSSDVQQDIVCLDKDFGLISGSTLTNPVKRHGPRNLAYVIYTSGSTGQPKGVMVPHRALCNHMCWMISGFDMDKSDIVFQKTPFSFDASVWEFFAPLLVGGQLVMAKPKGHTDCDYLVEAIKTYGVTIMQVVPSLLQMLLEHGGLSECHSVRHLFCGGEKLSRYLADRFSKTHHAQLHNLYGPTEACIDSLFWTVSADKYGQVIPIGRPVSNLKIYILDKHLQLVPIGVAGELHIGGPGLATGYINRPDLTEEKFISNPYREEQGERLYKTGDLARYLPDGNIEFLGRIDDQVKIRGFRIEPEEISQVLSKHPDIGQSYVYANHIRDGEKELVAYFVEREPVEISDIRSYLAEILPSYMIPAYFVSLEKLPLTINGKVDKKALPAPSGSGSVVMSDYTAPQNELQEKLVTIWESILITERIGIHDNFFELGGHSIKAMQLASRIHKEMKLEISLGNIFDFPTIAGLAAILGQKNPSAFADIAPLPEAEYYALSYAQRRLWLSVQKEENLSVYNIHGAVMLEGDLNIPAFHRAFETVVQRHESLRTTFINVEGEPKQKIHQDIGFKVETSDISDALEKEAIIAAHIRKEGDTPFDLSEGPLLRITLLEADPRKHCLILGMHHIISDGWSMEILVKEAFRLYEIYAAGEENPLVPLKIQYKDYAAWHNRLLADERDLREYWHEKLSDPPPVLNTFSDYPRPPVKTYHADTLLSEIDKELTNGLSNLRKESNASLFMVLVALAKTLFHRYTAQEDIILGTALAGRTRSELDEQVGFYVNLLPLRTRISGTDTFRTVLEKVRKTTTEAYDHQLYPFDRLVQELYPQRDPGRFPIFDIVVDLQDDELFNINAEGLEIKEIDNKLMTSEYDVAFMFTEHQDHITLRLEYNTDLFKRESVEKMRDRFMRVTKESLENPDVEISEIVLGETVAPREDVEISTRFNF